MRSKDLFFVASAAVAAAVAIVGCEAVKGAAKVGSKVGVITGDQATRVGEAADAVRASWHDFTDSEEYYIGRSVSARVFTQYKPLENDALNDYVTQIGTAVSMASDRPQTYGGYRFQVLDTDEVNAFAAPGGFIFVTRGTLALCENEDMLACVLAHEIGHVAQKHGLQAISNARVRDAFAALGKAGASAVLSGEQLDKASKALSGSVGDISDAMLKSGYGKSAEKEADSLGALFASRVGYDPNALLAFLDAMGRREGVKQGGTFATHPKAKDRMEIVSEKIADDKLGPLSQLAVRIPRFKAATGG